jgi:hypothetical protein
MKRPHVVLLAAVGCLFLSSSVAGQMGMNLFKKPNIADIFKPVVGEGSVYEQQRDGQKQADTPLEMTIVGKDTIDGQPAWWMEVGQVLGSSGGMVYSKVLVTKDFQFRKVVIQQPGQQAMEMPYQMVAGTDRHVQEGLDKWHQAGTETIMVPAGTFSCMHWKKDDGVGDAWLSDKVSPMSMVKWFETGRTSVLVKVITGASDHITGPVAKFDPQLFQQQMMQQRQKPQ